MDKFNTKPCTLLSGSPSSSKLACTVETFQHFYSQSYNYGKTCKEHDFRHKYWLEHGEQFWHSYISMDKFNAKPRTGLSRSPSSSKLPCTVGTFQHFYSQSYSYGKNVFFASCVLS